MHRKTPRTQVHAEQTVYILLGSGRYLPLPFCSLPEYCPNFFDMRQIPLESFILIRYT